jgi:dTDP-4-amino-4,6-dideoxygalactose transaminase
MTVPNNDLQAQYLSIKTEVDQAIQRVLNSGLFEMGEELETFEEEFARYHGVKHAVGVGSGTAALQVALWACGIGPGDEVISVPNTDISGASAVSHCGARIVWVDIDPRTYNMDPTMIEERITPRTKAILPVHLYGHPADMEPILSIARKHGLMVIEDAALALGARYGGQGVGTIGQAGCFSFAPGKIMGAYGDGGMVITNDDEIAARARLIHGYGEEGIKYLSFRDVAIHAPFNYVVEGLHSHLDTLQAAVLRVKLKELGAWLARRRENARLYDHLLDGVGVTIPFEQEGVEHVYRVYVIRVHDRDRIRRELAMQGIVTGLHYVPPLHLQPAYRPLGYKKGDFPITEQVADELLCLPVFPELTTQQIEQVVTALRTSLHRSQ